MKFSCRNNRLIIGAFLGILFCVQSAIGMGHRELNSIFRGSKTYATKELEDQARERIKKEWRNKHLVVGLATSVISISAPMMIDSIYWPVGGMVAALCNIRLVLWAYDNCPDSALRRRLEEEDFLNLEAPFNRTMIERADNSSLFRGYRAKRPLKRTDLFDGRYYQKYQEALMVGVDNYFKQCAQLHIEEGGGKKKRKVAGKCRSLKRIAEKALRLGHRMPRDVCNKILAYAGFDRYKPNNTPFLRLSERDILRVTYGNIPAHMLLRKSGSGQAVAVRYDISGPKNSIFSVVEHYRQYAFLQERGWIRFVDSDKEFSFSPRYIDSKVLKLLGCASIEMYSNQYYGPHFMPRDPEAFAKFYKFEEDPQYASIVTRLKGERDFVNRSQVGQRRKIYKEAFKK